VAGLSACGGGSSKASGGSSTTVSSALSPSPTTKGSSGSSANSLSQISSQVAAAEKSTFKAVYASTSGGQTQTITIEQMPPDSLFSSGTGEVINNGTTTYFCSTTGASQSCVTEQGGTNPLAGIVAAYSPATFLSVAQAAESATAAHVAGYNVTYSNGTFAGQASKCVSISGAGQGGKYCVTNGGILASVSTPASSFSLTSFSTNVSSSDFKPPSGASTQTIPSISLPPGQTLPPGITIP
jgi:hypothetical protein